LQDETCWLLAVDFDKETWQKDAAAFLVACREMNVPAVMERSRSGNGGHVWVFFNRAIPATTARKLGCAILTRTMEFRHQLGLESHDRFFPNQDTMPMGGLGNLIALPLQKIPRAEGNSVLVDLEFRPHQDQWAFLASLERMSANAVEAVVREPQKLGKKIHQRIVANLQVKEWATRPRASMDEECDLAVVCEGAFQASFVFLPEVNSKAISHHVVIFAANGVDAGFSVPRCITCPAVGCGHNCARSQDQKRETTLHCSQHHFIPPHE
jgi:hypothetical protein